MSEPGCSVMNTGDEESCERYEAMIACVDKFIKAMSDKPGTCKKLSKAFPKCYKDRPEVIQSMSDHMWDAFETNVKSHILALLKEFNLKSLLNKLAKAELAEEPTWRPSGNPKEDVKSWVGLAKRDGVVKLQQLLEQEESEVQSMRDQLSQKEDHLKSLLKEVEEQVEHWEELSDECDSKKEVIAKVRQEATL